MNQKRIAHVLKICSVATAMVGLLFFFWYIPLIIKQIADDNPEAAWLRWPGTIWVWAIALVCYLALWEFWRICTNIGADNSFCAANARSMKHIGLLAFLAAALILGGCIFLCCIEYFGAPIAVPAFLAISAALGVGILSIALSGLIQNAARLKEENDLTI